jgi:hypothetical protein
MAMKPSTAATTFTIPTMSAATGIRSVSPWRLLAALLLLAATVCGVIAAATWDDVSVEGAYLNRSIGRPAYSGVFTTWGVSNGPRILLGAAMGLAVAGVLVFAVSFIQSRRRAP